MAVIQTTVFTYVGSPDAFDAQIVQPLKEDVNAFLSTLTINTTLEVKYSYGQLQTTPAKVYGVATVLHVV